MLTATWLQATTYLLGVCPFSIAFLVYLNSSISFVLTDLLRLDHDIGDAVGTLGFVDELLALIACPFWGVLSDRIGVRTVCAIAYFIIALSLVIFVQCKNVYPQLLLARVLFSLGGAAASTMVTAVLPTMLAKPDAALSRQNNVESRENNDSGHEDEGACERIANPTSARRVSHAQSISASSQQTITPALYQSSTAKTKRATPTKDSLGAQEKAGSSQVAGYVGMFAGCGALFALITFLPLPDKLQRKGYSPETSLIYSYYIVAAVALVVSLWCFVGLRNLPEVITLTWPEFKQLSFCRKENADTGRLPTRLPWKDFWKAICLGFRHAEIGLGYVAGFVARSSSVGISLFVPLLVNSTFIEAGLCDRQSDHDSEGLPGLKDHCSKGYVLAAELTGVSQSVALVCAPLFGYGSARWSRSYGPLVVTAAAGVTGYIWLATRFHINPETQNANMEMFLSVSLLGLSQIGAIVCSLGLLSGGILAQGETAHAINETPSILSCEDNGADSQEGNVETAPLVAKLPPAQGENLSPLKGAIAGVYSLFGGAGILLLTKLGGFLFDRVSFGAPFYIMAVFNATLLSMCTILSLRSICVRKQRT